MPVIVKKLKEPQWYDFTAELDIKGAEPESSLKLAGW